MGPISPDNITSASTVLENVMNHLSSALTEMQRLKHMSSYDGTQLDRRQLALLNNNINRLQSEAKKLE